MGVQRTCISLGNSDLKATILDVGNLNESQVEVFNEIRFLNEWYSDQVKHFDLSLTQSFNQEQVNGIAEKYGTDYFLWTGIVSLRIPTKKMSSAELIISAMAFPVLPFVILTKVHPRYDMLHYAILFDVKTGKRQVLKFDFFQKQDTDDLLKAHMYHVFVQIKNDRKKR